MPKCLIHIGMHKTGSTSIQHSLAALDDDTHVYASILGVSNHSVPLYTAFASRPHRHPVNRARGYDQTTIRDQVQHIRKSLRTSVEAAGERTLVLSGEGLIKLNAKELHKLKKFFERRGFDVGVAAYVRAPVGFISSAFQEHLKAGNMTGFDISKLYPQYRRRFEKFDEVFGRDNVRFWKFDPAAFPDGSVVRDFCHRTGIDYLHVPEVRKNESISREVASIIYQYHVWSSENRRPRLTGGDAARIRKFLADLPATKLRVAPSVIRPVVEANSEDLAWMEERLGQSLHEDAGEDRDSDIAGDGDLLRPVPGAAALLAARLKESGVDVPEESGDETNPLIAAYVEAKLQTEGVRQRQRRQHGREAEAGPQEDLRPRRANAVGTAGTERSAALPGRLARRAHDAANAKVERAAARVARELRRQDSPGTIGESRAARSPAGEVRLLERAPRIFGNPITDGPRPMVNEDIRLTVLWSPKSACTTTYVWFAHVSGFSKEVQDYARWPHRHREEQYQLSQLYSRSIHGDLGANHVLRIIRDPYSRAVSIYRHALQTSFAEKELARFQGGRFTPESGFSFQTFLDLLATLDMKRVDIHFRPQFHPYEAVRKPDTVINISKQDLFTELNRFEEQNGYARTDFSELDWLKNLEQKRKARQEEMAGDALDTMPFTRHQVSKLHQFPRYDQLLTPEARQKIEAIYKVDFDAYSAFL